METVFGRIENGAVVEWQRSIPAPVVPEATEENPTPQPIYQDWRPLLAREPEIDKRTQQLGDPVDTLEPNRIVRTWPVVARPSDLVRSDMQAAVTAERDRRLERFSFSGKSFGFVDGKGSDVNIAGAATLSLAAIIAGSQPNDLRWADPANDFGWVADDNTRVLMDAQTCLNFAKAAAAWKSAHIAAARTIKDMNPIPADYAADSRWP